MRPLSELLHRLRHLRAPPGRPARQLAVPSRGEDPAGELSSILPKLDAIDEQTRGILAAAQAQAATIEAEAQVSAKEIMADAGRRSARERIEIIAAGRAHAEREAAEILDAGRAQARRVGEHAAAHTQDLLDEVVSSLRRGP